MQLAYVTAGRVINSYTGGLGCLRRRECRFLLRVEGNMSRVDFIESRKKNQKLKIKQLNDALCNFIEVFSLQQHARISRGKWKARHFRS